MGIIFLALGTTLLFNTPLLIIGNCFILAGDKSFPSHNFEGFPSYCSPIDPFYALLCGLFLPHVLGLVFVIGFERTRLYYDIFRDNLHDGRALAWAGFVIVVSGLLAELITKMPIINRLYKWVPWIKEIVESTDKELVTLTR